MTAKIEPTEELGGGISQRARVHNLCVIDSLGFAPQELSKYNCFLNIIDVTLKILTRTENQ